jgi:hypothetical protein
MVEAQGFGAGERAKTEMGTAPTYATTYHDTIHPSTLYSVLLVLVLDDRPRSSPYHLGTTANHESDPASIRSCRCRGTSTLGV